MSRFLPENPFLQADGELIPHLIRSRYLSNNLDIIYLKDVGTYSLNFF